MIQSVKRTSALCKNQIKHKVTKKMGGVDSKESASSVTPLFRCYNHYSRGNATLKYGIFIIPKKTKSPRIKKARTLNGFQLLKMVTASNLALHVLFCPTRCPIDTVLSNLCQTYHNVDKAHQHFVLLQLALSQTSQGIAWCGSL